VRVWAILNAKTPVARTAPQVRYRDDTDDVSSDAEDQCVGKSSQRDSAVIPIKLLAEGGQFEKDSCDTFYLE
jgi:hypothetical protein